MRKLGAALKLLGFASLILLTIPVQGLALLISKGPLSLKLPYYFHKIACVIFGIRYEIIGAPTKDCQTLYMGNHISYLDIPLLGGVIKASFVAKSEVESWPLFGLLAKLQRTAFIQRDRADIKKQKSALQTRIADGESLIIFPEGTSTDGQSVLPFKSSLFSLALGENNETLYIQPLTIKVIEIDGRTPETQHDRDLYSWHINMDTPLAEHLWGFAQTSGAKLQLTFHPALKASDFSDRKVLAKTCHDNVSKGLERAIAA